MKKEFKIGVDLDIFDMEKIKGFVDASPAGTIELSYSADIEMREWGIKAINFYVIEQKVEAVIDMWEDNEDGSLDSYDFEIELKNIELYMENGNARFPSSVQVKLSKVERVGEGKFKAVSEKTVVIF